MQAKKIINGPQAELVFSHASLWEMTLKSTANKMTFPKPLRRWIEEQEQIWRFTWLGISKEHILTTEELPRHHKDPFDRLIVAQGLRENMPILTSDKYIQAYPVECVW